MSLLLGWIGSICLALSPLPQAIKCMYQGHSRGLSIIMLTLWGTGEICYIAAVWMEFGWVVWMMVNYILNLAWVTIIFRYRLWPRK